MACTSPLKTVGEFTVPVKLHKDVDRAFEGCHREVSGRGKGFRDGGPVARSGRVVGLRRSKYNPLATLMNTKTNSDVFAPLVGQTANGCWLGHGNALFLEFGQPQPLPNDRTHPRGEVGLSCDVVEWRIERRDHVIAGSEDERATMEAGVGALDGKAFVSGRLLLPSGDSVLTFSDDLILRTFVITSEEDARWTFRDQKGKYFCLGPDQTYPVEQTPPGEPR